MTGFLTRRIISGGIPARLGDEQASSHADAVPVALRFAVRLTGLSTAGAAVTACLRSGTTTGISSGDAASGKDGMPVELTEPSPQPAEARLDVGLIRGAGSVEESGWEISVTPDVSSGIGGQHAIHVLWFHFTWRPS